MMVLMLTLMKKMVVIGEFGNGAVRSTSKSSSSSVAVAI